jgi:hypothetical protein
MILRTWVFRDMLLFGIGFAIGRNRDLLGRMLKEHVTDDASQPARREGVPGAPRALRL